MSTWLVILIVAVALVVLAVIAMSVMRRRRSTQLREGFGPEYDRTVDEAGSRRKAEADLAEREKRREQLDIRPLTPAAGDRFMDRWRETQARFVDDPGSAVGDADNLVQEVMRERGYPTDDFEQRASDISVDHPHIVENYRAAHGISLANASGKASTEDLRQSLFEELLETGNPDGAEVER